LGALGKGTDDIMAEEAVGILFVSGIFSSVVELGELAMI
jgi:hypothetical protein